MTKNGPSKRQNLHDDLLIKTQVIVEHQRCPDIEVEHPKAIANQGNLLRQGCFVSGIGPPPAQEVRLEGLESARVASSKGDSRATPFKSGKSIDCRSEKFDLKSVNRHLGTADTPNSPGKGTVDVGQKLIEMDVGDGHELAEPEERLIGALNKGL